MRIVCPNCSAHYDVADNAIPATGREVQCTNCEHVWLQEPALVLQEPAPAEEPAYFRTTRTETPPRPDPAPEPVEPTLPERASTPIPTATPTQEEDVLDVLRSEAAYAETRAKTPQPTVAEVQPDDASVDDNDDALTMAALSASVAAKLQTPEPKTDASKPEQSRTPEHEPFDPTEDEPAIDLPPTPTDDTVAIDDFDDSTDLDDTIASDEIDNDDTSIIMDADTDTDDIIADPVGTDGEDDVIAVGFTQPDDDIADPRASHDEVDRPLETAKAAAATVAAGTAAVAANPFRKFKPKGDIGTEHAAEKTRAQETYEESAAKSASVDDLSLDQLGFKRPKSKSAPQTPAKPEPAAKTPNPAPDAEPEKKRSKFGKDVFTDVDMLGSTLEEEAEKESERAAAQRTISKMLDDDDGEDDVIKPANSGGSKLFWAGFWAACFLVVVATSIYYFAPYARALAPFASGPIDTFVAVVDQGRRGLQDLYASGGEPSLSNFGKNAMDAIMGRG